MPESWTILKLLQWTTGYLKTKKIESPRLESEVLLAHLLNLKRIDLYVQFERILTPVELASFKALLKRRVDHEPLAYIVGKKEFYGREFFVSPDVLVPRPETEGLVEVVLNCCRGTACRAQMIEGTACCAPTADNEQSMMTGLDIGLGSGCVSISLLCETSALTMDAIEISEKAIDVAKRNAEKHSVSDRLSVSQGDFLELVIARHEVPRQSSRYTGSPRDQEVARDDERKQYDFIVSNPPYVSTVEMNQLPETVKKHEPKIALEAGNDGLLFYPKIAAFAKEHLKENGFLAVEIGEDQGYRVAEIFKEHDFVKVEIKKDLTGRERIVWTKLSSPAESL